MTRYSRQRSDGWQRPRLGRLYTSVVVDQMSGLGHPEYGLNSRAYVMALHKLPPLLDPLLDPTLNLRGHVPWGAVQRGGAQLWWQGVYPWPL